MQIHIMIILIHYKFYGILPIGHLVMAQFCFILNQYKGNNSCITEAILTKLDIFQRIMVIYIYIYIYKFNEIPSIGQAQFVNFKSVQGQ